MRWRIGAWLERLDEKGLILDIGTFQKAEVLCSKLNFSQ